MREIAGAHVCSGDFAFCCVRQIGRPYSEGTNATIRYGQTNCVGVGPFAFPWK